MEGGITIIGIKTATNVKTEFITGTITITIYVPISLHIINHVALYMIKKAANYKTTPKKNKKSLKLNTLLPYSIFLGLTSSKTPFLSNPLISF